MKQISFADAEYAGKHKRTRRERFLTEMGKVVPWKGLITLIELYYPKDEGGGRTISGDGHVACVSDVKLVRLQRSGN